VIWVCHALTGNSDVAVWWSSLFGPGRALDPERYFIVCANVLGGCYGSVGPRSIDPRTGRPYGGHFPVITIGDLVEHQRLLAERLGIAAIEVVIGGSMGGFQALEWAVREPERVGKIAVIASSFRQPPQAVAQAELQLALIRRDPKYRDGHYPADDPPHEGLALARQLGHLTYRSATELDRRFGRERRGDGKLQVLSYLEHQGLKLVRRFDAVSYVRLTEAMNAFDLCAGRGEVRFVLGRIRQPALVVAIDSDQLYYPVEQERLAHALPNARLHGVSSLYGHDAFLIDTGGFADELRAFIDGGGAVAKRCGSHGP
jgi:homoserine O-acetyltransferase